MKKLFLLLALVVSGCSTPHSYNDPLEPDKVTFAELAAHANDLETKYQDQTQVDGIIWQRTRSNPALDAPDRYGSGGDSCIFTGHKLAADVYRYQVTGEREDLDRVLQSLGGLHILVNATGTPGVITRCAFPATRKAEWQFPEMWQHRIDGGFVAEGPTTTNPFSGVSKTYIYYSRGTKDQLTGLLYGAGALEALLESKHPSHDADIAKAKVVNAQIVEDVYNHLRLYDFKIRDQKGENDTNADSVEHLIKLQLLAVYKETVIRTSPSRAARIKEKYDDAFHSSFFGVYQTLADLFNKFNNYSQYYAWNLRYLRAYTIYLLEDRVEKQEKIKTWVSTNLWPYVKDHFNTKFIYLHNAITQDHSRLDDALLALKSLSLKSYRHQNSPLADDERKPSFLQVMFNSWDEFVLLPHLRKPTEYTTWQKEPWDTGNSYYNGSSQSTGLDFILTYWLGRYHGFF